MSQSFEHYKAMESTKVLTIIHAAVAVSTAALYKLGPTQNASFLVLAIVAAASTYGYWYLADGAVYHETKAGKEGWQEMRKAWSVLQRRTQKRAFISGIFTWAALITGLTSAFVLNLEWLPSWLGIVLISASTLLVLFCLWCDFKAHQDIIKQSWND